MDTPQTELEGSVIIIRSSVVHYQFFGLTGNVPDHRSSSILGHGVVTALGSIGASASIRFPARKQKAGRSIRSALT